MRLFFALPIPANLQLEIDHWCTVALCAAQDRIPARNYHMTLAFLGEVPPSRLDQLMQDADHALASIQPGFADRNIPINQTGYFARPGIFWIGPSQTSKTLMQLSQLLQQAGNRIGCPSNRQSFQPHISLIRNCHDLIAPLAAPDFQLPLTEVVLFESQQGRSGVQYHDLASWPLDMAPAKPFPGRPSLPPRRRTRN